jgi:phosphatidylserine/phosphatidylglycerophosphate/cardiolipin synthase-like enzyme/regulation of enolase protein 1 (concanavalin A-like superfamily)
VIACAIVAALCAAAPRAHAAERLCDPSFENCRNQLLSLIDSELMGIDVAFWFMEDSRYATHIINRWKAGVPVRLIIDPRANPSYPLNASMLSMFQQAGIPMVKKTSGGIMHWKTMVFAGQNTVEFGSANYSDNAFVPVAPYTNYVSETVYYTDDAALVNSFKTKFDNLWTDTTNYSAYANVTSRVRVYPTFTISADLNFPPGQSYANRVIALEKAETQKIDVNMYRITQQAHSDAIIAAFRRGVPIRYLGETREYRDTTRIWVSWNLDRMYAAGVPMKVRLHDGENHEKVVLLYGQGLTVFGSSNWTSASDNSQQEHNYFTTKTWIFQWFEDQFDRMWNNTNPNGAIESTPFVPGPPDTPSYRSIANGATGVATTGQRLVWYGGPWAHLYDIYFGTDSSASTLVAANQPLGPSDTTSKTQSYALPSLQSGTTYYWKIVSKTAAMVSRTGPVWSFTTSGSSSGGQLPVPWLDRDIGSVGVAGSAQFSNGTFTVKASGADVWGAADAFHYAYQPWSGDGSIVARVAGVTNTSAWAKAGVMFRASLDAGSAHAFMLVSAANGVSFQRRPTAGGTSVSTNVAGVTPPRWVRLDRSGNTFTAYYSSDGTSWTLVATDTITMPQDLFVGMAVTSHNNTTLTTATLDSVTVSQGPDTGGLPPPPWLERDIGSVAIAGSAQFANGTFTVKASGADIWGTADAFHYVYQTWTGDGSIIARVGSVSNTNAWAKAGVMFRETTGAGSRHALMLLSAANGVSFLRRGATGGTSVSTTVAGVTAPRWVRLDRSGDTFTAYHSSDGTTWTLVGTDTITMPQSLLVGLAVTSHNNAALTTATFTTVTAQ